MLKKLEVRPCNFCFSPHHDCVAVDMMIRGLQPETPQPGLSTGMDVLEGALKKLSFMLDTVTRYVDDVVVSLFCFVACSWITVRRPASKPPTPHSGE